MNKISHMSKGFRIESNHKLTSDWLPKTEFTKIHSDLSYAIATAIEGVDDPKQEVRIVDISTNQVVWRSTEVPQNGQIRLGQRNDQRNGDADYA